MNNYERLKIAYELSDEMLNKYKSNVKIIEINKKIKNGKNKNFEAIIWSFKYSMDRIRSIW